MSKELPLCDRCRALTEVLTVEDMPKIVDANEKLVKGLLNEPVESNGI